MSYCLYLDDVREPETDRDWIVVRSYDEFVDTIQEKGLPERISFDHDLGENVPSGYDAVKWLVNQAMDGRFSLEDVDINVHSANPVGRKNIESYIETFKRVYYD